MNRIFDESGKKKQIESFVCFELGEIQKKRLAFPLSSCAAVEAASAVAAAAAAAFQT